MDKPSYYVGIDLGTTNSVLAYIKADKPYDPPKILAIPQYMENGTVESLDKLPSAIYILARDEHEKMNVTLPWHSTQSRYVIGQGALQLGQRRSHQLVQSAKSWLSHRQVDRYSPILPWGSDSDAKLSPFHATLLLLEYIRQCWDHVFTDAPLSQQRVVLTLPASFDEEARAITLEAAKKAGITQLHLLEEPQAACYSWINTMDNLHALATKKMLLVVDVGGGTTDFSLVSITTLAKEGQPDKVHLQRVAVGDHLLLGGDNLDQALAYQLDPRQIADLSSTRLAALVQQTRQAKEALLAESAPDSLMITVLGGGRKLIGGSQKFVVEQSPLMHMIETGFFPSVALSANLVTAHYGLQTLSLPYEKDPAISRHLATFLCQHQTTLQEVCGEHLPDAVLLNGGAFNSSYIKKLLLDQLQLWRGEALFECQGINPNHAVAEGAAYYAISLDFERVKIESGAAHTLLLEIANNHYLTILPKHSPRNVPLTLPIPLLARIGETVKFPLFRADDTLTCHVGSLVTDSSQVHYISTLTADLHAPQATSTHALDVSLTSMLSEVGLLEVVLNVDKPKTQWRLHFSTQPTFATEQSDDVALHARTGEAEEHLVKCFSMAGQKTQPDLIKSLKQDIDAILGDRSQWNLATSRRLVDKLIQLKSGRSKSVVHERQWLLLLGFCLRPGWGADLDDERIQHISSVLQNAPKHDDVSVWEQYWTFWRRVAGGVSLTQQEQLFTLFASYCSPTGLRSREKQKQLSMRSADDLIRLVGSLELLSQSHKTDLCDWLLKRLDKSTESDTAWWSIGRTASRCLLYADDCYRLPEDKVFGPLEAALNEDWKKRKQAGLAAVLMSQACVDESSKMLSLRRKVMQKLVKDKCPRAWLERLENTHAQPDKVQLQHLIGDGLPIGLMLK